MEKQKKSAPVDPRKGKTLSSFRLKSNIKNPLGRVVTEPSKPVSIPVNVKMDLKSALAYYTTEPHLFFKDTESMIHLVETALGEMQRIVKRNKDNLKRTANVEELEEIASLISLAQHVRAERLIIEAYRVTTRAYFEYKETDRCEEFLLQAMVMARWWEDLLAEQECYELLGECKLTKLDWEGAISAFCKMLKVALNRRDLAVEFRAYDRLAKASLFIGDDHSAKFLHERVVSGYFEPENSPLRKLTIPPTDKRTGYPRPGTYEPPPLEPLTLADLKARNNSMQIEEAPLRVFINHLSPNRNFRLYQETSFGSKPERTIYKAADYDITIRNASLSKVKTSLENFNSQLQIGLCHLQSLKYFAAEDARKNREQKEQIAISQVKKRTALAIKSLVSLTSNKIGPFR
jgi:hypothetical protein